ncbi:contractile protein-like motif protein [Ranid herpesvirus 3]|uniref:Contractile protein-like motif protein n=1 Tax=Ranid herpesvirus 3 TaxID=1987509 RepID=A0A1X9T574_9VIRU|nr:contractile protein-like motif protein [Ranid herpesvirus 3]ARR28851.1 contractile protein-like motif protein [Ranid herpesvirus 3]
MARSMHTSTLMGEFHDKALKGDIRAGNLWTKTLITPQEFIRGKTIVSSERVLETHVLHDNKCPPRILFSYKLAKKTAKKKVTTDWFLNDMNINQYMYQPSNKSIDVVQLLIPQFEIKTEDALRLELTIKKETKVVDYILRDLTVPQVTKFSITSTESGRYAIWSVLINNEQNVKELKWFVNGIEMNAGETYKADPAVYLHLPWYDEPSHDQLRGCGSYNTEGTAKWSMLDQIRPSFELELKLDVIARDNRVYRYIHTSLFVASDYLKRNAAACQPNNTCERDLFMLLCDCEKCPKTVTVPEGEEQESINKCKCNWLCTCEQSFCRYDDRLRVPEVYFDLPFKNQTRYNAL